MSYREGRKEDGREGGREETRRERKRGNIKIKNSVLAYDGK